MSPNPENPVLEYESAFAFTSMDAEAFLSSLPEKFMPKERMAKLREKYGNQ